MIWFFVVTIILAINTSGVAVNFYHVYMIVGSPHQIVKIDTVFNELKQDFTQLRAEVEQRKSELSAIAKESDRFLAQYGEETNEMVKLLNETRDEQVIDNKN